MATIKVWKSEVNKGLLPPVCVVCGADADRDQRVTFRWHPSWVVLLILINLLVYAVVAMALRKTVKAAWPVCGRHPNHWFYRQLFLWCGVLAALAGVVVGVFLTSDPNLKDASEIVLIGSAFGFLVTLIVAVVLHLSSVRPTYIDDRTVTLTGVSQGFVDALRADRERDEEEEDREWQQRRARQFR